MPASAAKLSPRLKRSSTTGAADLSCGVRLAISPECSRFEDQRRT
jgi:hypothetical protein